MGPNTVVTGFSGKVRVLKLCPWGECLSLDFSSLTPKLKSPVACPCPWGKVKEVVGA